MSTAITKCEVIKKFFTDNSKITKIGRSLILITLMFLSLFSTCEFNTTESYAAEDSAIVGYWPYYVDASSYQPDWNVLTHVVYYYWAANSDGTLTPAQLQDNFASVKTQAHQHGVKVIIGVFSNNSNTIDNIIANHKTDFANNVLSLIQSSGADGVNLDFEFPSDTNTITHKSNTLLFEQFMNKLYTTLKTANPAYHISYNIGKEVKYVASYNNANLKQYTDYIYLMGYDYSYIRTDPNSPYDDPTRYDIVDSVKDLSKYYNKSQIILVLPFYCYHFTTTSDEAGAIATSSNSIGIKTAISEATNHGRKWDSNSNTPWYVYHVGKTYHQVWYDDSQSLLLKDNYTKSAHLGGIGFYPLGLEPSNIWSVF